MESMIAMFCLNKSNAPFHSEAVEFSALWETFSMNPSMFFVDYVVSTIESTKQNIVLSPEFAKVHTRHNLNNRANTTAQCFRLEQV